MGQAKSRRGDADNKEDDAGRRNGRGEMHRAHVDDRIGHAGCLWSACWVRLFGSAHFPPTWKVKLPSVVCVSTESACHRTRYVPGPDALIPTRIVLPLTWALPWLTSTPLPSVTTTVENAGSRLCVNVSATSCGAASTVEPTSGLA